MSTWIIQSTTGRFLKPSGKFSERRARAQTFERFRHATRRMDELDLWSIAIPVELNDWEPDATRQKNNDIDERKKTSG